MLVLLLLLLLLIVLPVPAAGSVATRPGAVREGSSSLAAVRGCLQGVWNAGNVKEKTVINIKDKKRRYGGSSAGVIELKEEEEDERKATKGGRKRRPTWVTEISGAVSVP